MLGKPEYAVHVNSVTGALPQLPRHGRTRVEERYVPKRKSYFNPALIALGVIPILSFSLGVWQVQRLKWKVDLIDELTEKLQREPISLPSTVNVSAIPEFLYRKVVVRGRWDHAHGMLLGPRVMDGTRGYHVVTPLVREDGSTILVNRGWVSEECASSGQFHSPTGVVEIQGMLRSTQARNMFTPENRPEKGEWYWADLDAMVEFAGGERANVQPVYAEEIFDGHIGDVQWRQKHGVPIGKYAVVDLRNSHLSYAVTWFSLSAFTAYMFVHLMSRKGGGRAMKGLPRSK
ncbi:mitochondrial protein required for respiration [Vararia minispora EC-137]|uniref:Mitochondrial protein required for respiration n=1 Tax=Vararia minispora EC-137 TaxID=1314806 RepID=A0ACB8QQR0_9AGAM|nr:mitochondrial protein required for respiration [Vararia minispora EC-137]